jgi:hypothetical protein
MGLLQRRNNDRMRSALSNAANSLPSVFQSNSDCLQLTKPRHSSASSQVLVPRPFLSGQYCDSRLEKLRISYWTKVPVSNKLAATLISFDIETHHKIIGLLRCRRLSRGPCRMSPNILLFLPRQRCSMSCMRKCFVVADCY